MLDNDDKTRIVLSFGEYDVTGFEIDRRLSEIYGIDIEMSDYLNIVLIATPWNTHRDFMALFRAIGDICESLAVRQDKIPYVIPPETDGTIEPSKAWYSDTEMVEPENAAGRMAARTVTVYPPGIAVIYPGEIISSEHIEYIESLAEAGAKISGMVDFKLEVVK